MATATITLNIPVPNVRATDDEIEEWLKFHLNYNGAITGTNPLINYEPEPRSISAFRIEK